MSWYYIWHDWEKKESEMKIDPLVKAILEKHGLDPVQALWNCRGTLVMYHKYIEQIAAKTGIKFSTPQVYESNSEKGVAMLVAGTITEMEGDIRMGERTEWSIGEAAPGNNKNAYPWAMAEKRAKDRVALKLLGLYGLVYSEEEADNFKPKEHGEMVGPLGKTELKEKMREFAGELAACEDEAMVIALVNSSSELLQQCSRDLHDWYYGKAGSDVKGALERIEERKRELNAKELAHGI